MKGKVMKEVCKYRLPCGRCDKYNIFCELSLKQINFIANKDCEHNWILKEQEIIKQKVSYKTYKCSICGKEQIIKTEIQDDGKFYETSWMRT